MIKILEMTSLDTKIKTEEVSLVCASLDALLQKVNKPILLPFIILVKNKGIIDSWDPSKQSVYSLSILNNLNMQFDVNFLHRILNEKGLLQAVQMTVMNNIYVDMRILKHVFSDVPDVKMRNNIIGKLSVKFSGSVALLYYLIRQRITNHNISCQQKITIIHTSPQFILHYTKGCKISPLLP